MIMEMVLDRHGEVVDSRVYRALVKNQVKLAYNNVADWLDGKGDLPESATRVKGMDEQLRLQDEFAQKMRKIRYKHGALDLETIEPRALMKDGTVVDMKDDPKNRAKELIEDFMIAANGVTARFLTKAGYPTLRRVVRSPERWERIVEVALDYGEKLPQRPDSKALSEFLSQRRAADPLRFPDLSLTIVKLLGRGEYVLEMPGGTPTGHFGLAVRDYSHSTAPNRRFPDLITHRLLKAALKKASSPYDRGELSFLANHCTAQENAADKVERQVRKSASAMFMARRLGEHFDAIVTGASEKGTWARVLHPPVEGKVVHGWHGLDVGDKIRVKLIEVNVERGFIDFVRLGS
jgi:exoribonuclease-2